MLKRDITMLNLDRNSTLLTEVTFARQRFAEVPHSLRSRLVGILLMFVAAGFPSAASAQMGQYDVSSFGALGDGHTDDRAALQLAINTVPSGATLTFGGPKKTFLIGGTLVFQPNRKYQGQNSAIVMNKQVLGHPPIAKLKYGLSDNVTITGLVFDGNGVAAGLQINVDGSTAIPVSNLQVTYDIFRNTTASPAGAWEGALFINGGLMNSVIANNQVINCGSGISIVNPNNVVVSDNSFETINVGNAISMTFYPAPFSYGQGIQVLRNTGHHLGRMAIELWSSGTPSSVISGATIADNAFSGWDVGLEAYPFGISVVAGQNMTLNHNKLLGGVRGWGIELAAPSSTISENTIQGFDVGIALNDSHHTSITGNLLTQLTSYGILLANGPGSRSNLVIGNNIIVNAKLAGIYINSPDWGGSTISGNLISRSAGNYQDDFQGSFTGVSVWPPNAPVTVSGNSITQSSFAGPSTFVFTGIQVNGGSGANSSSSYSNNTVMSLFPLLQSVGLYGNSSGSLNGTVVQGNNWSGLSSASGGVGSPSVISSGNLIYNCTQVGPTPVDR